MAETPITGIAFSSGYMTLTYQNGTRSRQPVDAILRAVDIPTGLTYNQVGAVTTLANLLVVLVRTLIDREVLDESFLESGDYDLDDIVGAIELMGGDYNLPDIEVT